MYGPPHPYRGPNITGRLTVSARLICWLKVASLAAYAGVVGAFFQYNWAVPPQWQAAVAVGIYFVVDLFVLVLALACVGFRR